MSILKDDISVSPSNYLNGYFPARTSGNDGAFDWEVAKGIVVRNLYEKKLAKKLVVKEIDSPTYAGFQQVCREDFEMRLDELELWDTLEEMYFSPDAFFDIAPECLLFKISNLTASSAKHRLGDLFSSLMQDYSNDKPERMKRNFLEQQVVDSLRSASVLEEFIDSKFSKGINEKPFLPFLSESFQRDIKFLSNRPSYLIENLEGLLKLYGYLYTAQLALNISSLSEEPVARPLYFIMENETASIERTDLSRNGHKRVSSKLNLIYPYLSMAETLYDATEIGARLPLWELASKLSQSDRGYLKSYAKEFASQRNLELDVDEENQEPLYWLATLLKLAEMQFDKSGDRKAALDRFTKSTEVELCNTFVRARGRAGKILVMNQDYLVLLTNLAIGEEQRLRFHELLLQFKARGVFFDKKTQQALIRFYERVGNVERMSDSGDAVYVRKTI